MELLKNERMMRKSRRPLASEQGNVICPSELVQFLYDLLQHIFHHRISQKILLLKNIKHIIDETKLTQRGNPYG